MSGSPYGRVCDVCDSIGFGKRRSGVGGGREGVYISAFPRAPFICFYWESTACLSTAIKEVITL